MALVDMSTVVSFAKTPLAEVSAKASEIEALGWREQDRGDPWVVLYRKAFPEGEHHDPDAELRRVMGDDWVNRDEMRELADRGAQSS